MNRRHALCCSAALVGGLFTSLTTHAAGMSWQEGWRNPCRGALPPDLARHELVLAAFDGIDPGALWDVHCHLLGTGDAGSGCTVNPQMAQWWHPAQVLRERAILDAACVARDSPSIDRAYVQRLLALTADFPAGARWLLYAFDYACDDHGRQMPAWTTFQVPNDYAAAMAAAHADRFAWVASVHPYRDDAVERLDAALSNGAIALKWLPSAMNIDLRDRRCSLLYDRLARSGTPLIVHCGEEKAVPGAGRDDLGNPLLVRAALARGVRVVMAHAASLGAASDLDRPSAPRVAAFDLWQRLMNETEGLGGLLHADISAVFQANREPRVWRSVIEHEAWHSRLLHGSDHPLPGVMPLHAPQRLADAGLLAASAVEPLRRIRAHNPLLFDFVLKRQLRAGDATLPASVFETRDYFAPRSPA
ncbi:MAG: amidohydrolase family protein [Proteobacteria bacterium]|nr:amidohydrolase family protein [Pseudomonadota bacterium]